MCKDFELKINQHENEIKNYLSIMENKDKIISSMDSKIQKLKLRVKSNDDDNINNDNNYNDNNNNQNENLLRNLRMDIENKFIDEIKEKDDLINELKKKIFHLKKLSKSCYEILGKIE
jgi:hypothetical protein